ncbi:MAG: AAA family ATPase [bacterium]
MKITSLKINNLYTYDEASIDFSDLSVIVGPNGGGKTNIIRALKTLIVPDNNTIINSLLPNFKRYNKDKSSSIKLDFKLYGNEAYLISGFIDGFDIDENIGKEYEDKNVTLFINWDAGGDPKQQDIVAIMFPYQNKSAIYTRFIGLGGIVINDIERNDLNDINKLKEKIEEKVQSKEHKSLEELHCNDWNNKNCLLSKKTYIKSLCEFCSLSLENSDFVLSLELFISRLLSKNLVFFSEFQNNEDKLAKTLYDIKNLEGYEYIYGCIKDQFNKFELDFDVRRHIEYNAFNPLNPINVEQPVCPLNQIINTQQSSVPNEEKIFIEIKEITDQKDGRYYNVEDTASGYYDVLALLTEIAYKKNSIIILDEPLTRAHPSLQKKILKFIMDPSNLNQIIVVTHSPSFLDKELIKQILNKDYKNNDNNSYSKNLIYVRRNDRISKIYQRRADANSDKENLIKPHLIKPEIFFANYVIAVEGPGEETLFSKMFETLNYFDADSLNVYLYVIQGKGNVPLFANTMDKFGIKYFIIVDNDFKEEDVYWKKLKNKDYERLVEYPSGDSNGYIFVINKENKDLETVFEKAALHKKSEVDNKKIIDKIKKLSNMCDDAKNNNIPIEDKIKALCKLSNDICRSTSKKLTPDDVYTILEKDTEIYKNLKNTPYGKFLELIKSLIEGNKDNKVLKN